MTSNPQAQTATTQMAVSRSEIERWLKANPDSTPSGDQVLGQNPAVGLQSQLISLALSSMTESLFGKNSPVAQVQTPGQMGKQVAEQVLYPLAKRHPWALVGAAALTGGAMVVAKPWRWFIRPEFIGAIATQVVTRALAKAKANTVPNQF
jgi:hypothetical protein